MRKYTIYFLERFLKAHPIKGKVLDVGSRNINGSVKSQLLNAGFEYTGLDMIEGSGVDVVCNAHDMNKVLDLESFDMVCCFDTLEHDDKFWLTVENMKWVLKRGGWLLLCMPSCSFAIHEWPSDYYRFLPATMKMFLDGYEECYFRTIGHSLLPSEVFGWGRKP